MIKKSSRVYKDALKRLAAVKSIDVALDLGNNLTVANFQAKIDAVNGSLEAYNTHLSQAEGLRSVLINTEKDLASLAELMLLGVAAKYGKNSAEYQKAGGTRKDDRKKPKRTIPVV